MVQWPGRRAKMIKWRTPIGTWATWFAYGTYAFIGWNLIPYVIYRWRQRTYEEEFLAGKHKKPFEKLDRSEKYYAFFGWKRDHVPKTILNLDDWTVETWELPPGTEKLKSLHSLPTAEIEALDFEDRQKTIADIQRKLTKKEPLKDTPIPGAKFVYSPNAIFE